MPFLVSASTAAYSICFSEVLCLVCRRGVRIGGACEIGGLD